MRFTAVQQYDNVPCFVYALVLAIILKDHNANYVEQRFSICKQKVLDRFQYISFSAHKTRYMLKLTDQYTKVNYCVVMSMCEKCTDGHPCEACSQTFSYLKGRDALKYFFHVGV